MAPNSSKVFASRISSLEAQGCSRRFRSLIRLEIQEVNFQAAEQLTSPFSLQSSFAALGTSCYKLMPCPNATHPISSVRNQNTHGTQDNLQILVHLVRTATITMPGKPHCKPVWKSFAVACEDIDARTHPLLADVGILSGPHQEVYACALSGLQHSLGIRGESSNRNVYHAGRQAGRTHTRISAAGFSTCWPLARRAGDQLGWSN